MVVRSWNLFHGNSAPPGRRAYLEEMVRLVSHDAPALVCLQEVPAWALNRLEAWSGMRAVGDVAASPSVGPVPVSREVGRALTLANHGLFRSAFAGQANAILVAPSLRVLDRHLLVLNPPRFRRAQARWLRLRATARLAWASERRVCQGVRLRTRDGRTLLVANLHATSYPADERLADAELLRAATFADALAGLGDLCVLAGDFNAKPGRSWTLETLTGDEWGFSAPGAWIDHVLVRGAPATPVRRWPDELRRHDGALLSDHPPVEVAIG